jgi:ketosteroid isomerase-like protein
MQMPMIVLTLLLAAGTPLRDEIAAADAAMFAAFNAHDADGLGAWFASDLEFYHDKDGRISYGHVMQGFRTIFARNDGIHRELLKETLEVYPVKGFGAIEVGSHRFCHVENGRDDCGTFRFAMVWRKDADQWRVSRVLSYDHN